MRQGVGRAVAGRGGGGWWHCRSADELRSRASWVVRRACWRRGCCVGRSWCGAVVQEHGPLVGGVSARGQIWAYGPDLGLTWAYGPVLGMTWAADHVCAVCVGRSFSWRSAWSRLVHRSCKGTRKEGRQQARVAGVMLEVVTAASMASIKCWPLVGSVHNWRFRGAFLWTVRTDGRAGRNPCVLVGRRRRLWASSPS
jgi:hypothetical protein